MQALAPRRGGPLDVLVTRERRRKPDYGTRVDRMPSGVDASHGVVRVLRVTDQTPCDILRGRRLITEHEHAAAEQLWRDWYRGGATTSLTTRYDGAIRVREQTCGMPATEIQAHHRERFRRAIDALQERAGALSCTYTIAIVIDQRSPQDAGAEYSGRRDSAQVRAVAIDRLREGLRVLARHYGLDRR